MNFESIVAEHGSLVYLATFLWTALEGETFVIFAAFAAHGGAVDLRAIFALAWLGSFLGDQFYFFLGRRFGPRLLRRFPRSRPGAERALRLLERRKTLFVLGFRFLYGVRNISSFAMGLSAIGWLRFAILNAIAAGLWAGSFVALGYFAGDVVARTLGPGLDYFGFGALAAMVVAGVWLMRRSRPRPGRAASAPAPGAGDPRKPGDRDGAARQPV